MKVGARSSLDFESASGQRPAETGHTPDSFPDAALMLLIILGLTALLFGGVVLFRRPLRQLRQRLRHALEFPLNNKSRDHAHGTTHHRRKRRRRRMNPSRAQMGGLPPRRQDPPLGPANT